MKAEADTGGRGDARGLAGKAAGRITSPREGLLHQGRRLSIGFVGHGEPVKAVEQGQPGLVRVHVPGACSMEAEGLL